MKRILGALALAMAACSPAPQSEQPIPVEGEPQAVAQAPGDVMAAINAALPGFVPSHVVMDNSTGAEGYRVEGAAAGKTYNVQLMHASDGWNVVVIRRDIAWADAPAPVRAAAGGAAPTRVVERREPGTDGVVYELYTSSAEAPSTEIRLVGDEAAVMPPAH
jgi:hypothetical protein